LKDLRKGTDERLLERLARIIPGYGGYKDKEIRREADRAQRMYLSRRLGEVRSSLLSVNAELTDRGYLDLLDDSDRTSRRLEKIGDRIRFASHGYAGFFDLVKVGEEELDRMYEFDATLLEKVAGMKEAVEGLSGALESQDRTLEKVREIDSLIGEMEMKLNEREELLRGMA